MLPPEPTLKEIARRVRDDRQGIHPILPLTIVEALLAAGYLTRHDLPLLGYVRLTASIIVDAGKLSWQPRLGRLVLVTETNGQRRLDRIIDHLEMGSDLDPGSDSWLPAYGRLQRYAASLDALLAIVPFPENPDEQPFYGSALHPFWRAVDVYDRWLLIDRDKAATPLFANHSDACLAADAGLLGFTPAFTRRSAPPPHRFIWINRINSDDLGDDLL